MTSPTDGQARRGWVLSREAESYHEWTVSALDGADPEWTSITQVISELKENRDRFQRSLPLYLAATALAALITIIVSVNLLGIPGMFVGFVLAALIRSAIFSGAQRSSLKALAHYRHLHVDNLSSIGDLIDISRPRISVRSEHPDIQLWAKKLLTALLPFISNAEECGITQSRLDVLHKLLNAADSGLAIAILKALEFVGNNTSKPYVTARMRRSIHDTEVLDRTIKVMTAIENRQTQLEIKGTLLRGSSISGDTNTMLRPVIAAQQPEPEQLLRASLDREL